MSTVNIDDIRHFLEKYVAGEPQRSGTPDFWRKPVVVSARADERFDILPQIAMNEHVLPRDLLETARSVLVFFIPFQKWLVRENREGDRPCENWARAYVCTNDLIERVSQAVGDLLKEAGFESGLTPATHNFDEKKLMARWSHKHLAHIADLGRFGSHYMLITPEGCCGRLGSLVTEADLGDHPLIATRDACFVKAGKKCGKCIERCPVGALKETDFDRKACWDRLNENKEVLDYFGSLPETTDVCGKCAAMMPCSFTNPVKT